jgi:hypothetical protein
VGVWLCEATDLSLVGGGQGTILVRHQVPSPWHPMLKTVEKLRTNAPPPPPGGSVSSGAKGRRGQERVRLMVPTGVRVLGLVHG